MRPLAGETVTALAPELVRLTPTRRPAVGAGSVTAKVPAMASATTSSPLAAVYAPVFVAVGVRPPTPPPVPAEGGWTFTPMSGPPHVQIGAVVVAGDDGRCPRGRVDRHSGGRPADREAQGGPAGGVLREQQNDAPGRDKIGQRHRRVGGQRPQQPDVLVGRRVEGVGGTKVAAGDKPR